ncbi:PAS domain-containing protein [Minwuia thermotolerans]|nr:PAS domain-containing protein [Minwuia thermotolerans]
MRFETMDEGGLATTPVGFLSSLLNTIGIPVFVIGVRDNGYEIEFVNAFYENAFGIDAAELNGRRLEEVLSPQQAEAVARNYRRCIEGGDVERYDEEIVLPSGFFFARTVLTPLRHGGRVVRLIGTTLDLTDRRRLELELATARDRAEVANTAKSSFMANMSHELRTPLNAVIGFSEMLGSELFGPLGNEKYKSYVDDIRFAGRHLLAVVNDILDLARIESGSTEMVEEDCPVGDLIDEAIRLTSERSEAGGESVDRGRCPSDITVFADRRMLRQALVNLIANARKYMKPGGRILAGAELLDDGRIAFFVTDTGRGIAAHDLPTALAPFGRIDHAYDGQTQGAGLGLPITRALIEVHGGNIYVNSQPGIGTTVFLVLPAGRVQAPEGRRPAPSVEGLKAFFTIDGVNLPAEALHMDDAQLDQLPVGAVLLDESGRVLKYNDTESGFSEMRPERVIGRSFFREVAPCTFTDAFHGRFREVSQGRSVSELFSYVFTLRRTWKVLIEMRPGAEAGTVWLFIRWV